MISVHFQANFGAFSFLLWKKKQQFLHFLSLFLEFEDVLLFSVDVWSVCFLQKKQEIEDISLAREEFALGIFRSSLKA